MWNLQPTKTAGRGALVVESFTGAHCEIRHARAESCSAREKMKKIISEKDLFGTAPKEFKLEIFIVHVRYDS